METLVKADIFFFVTTVAIVIIAILFVVALIYAIKILRDFKYISSRVKHEGDEIIKDVESLRESIKEEGFRVSGIGRFIKSIFGIGKRPKKRL